jgi:predicted DNA-binding transcriptional regulator YafY
VNNKFLEFRFKDIDRSFPDEDSCIEWIKNQIYPAGIKCPICDKVTKHHKVSKIHSYACDKCGNHVNPVAATVFRNSRIPLKTWFKVIKRMSSAKSKISVKTIQREYGLNYWKTRRMISKIEQYFNENASLPIDELKSDMINTSDVQFKTTDNGTRKQQIGTDYQNFNGSIRRRDRTARLLYMQILLYHHPQGIEVKDLARSCNTCARTVYRDLAALESELKVPIWQEGSKRGLVEGYFLPPIAFRQEEAMNIFWAAYLLQTYSHLYNPNVISTFTKLSSLLPAELKKQLTELLENMESMPRDERKINNLNKLCTAWVTRHMVKIRYQTLSENEEKERIIEPYFIEPIQIARSIFVIAYCHLQNSIINFKLDKIHGDVEILPDTYVIPLDFHPSSYNSPLNMATPRELVTVKLHFLSGYSRSFFDTIWYPSQTIETLSDGTVIMTLIIYLSDSFFAWFLGLKGRVEVIEPEILRNSVIEKAMSLLSIHSKAVPTI